MVKKISSILKRNNQARLVIIVILAVLTYLLAPDSMTEVSKRELFIFVIAAFFWAFEIVPLYATSILVVILEVLLLCRPGGILGMNTAGYEVFLLPFGSPIIILFFGGFILAKALKKYEIDQMIATHLLKIFGHSPYFIMVGFMVTTAFLSMWMSNTATTAMMIAMVLPLLGQLDEKDSFRTGLILCIAFAASIGGMATPVGTPPNAIAIGILANKGINVDFLSWMKMAFPLSMILLAMASLILYVLFPPKNNNLVLKFENHKKLNKDAVITILIALLTIGLWLTSSLHGIPSAVVALLAAGLFALSGLLQKEDFQALNWDVLILMWGGLALGKGMEISGLAKWVVALPLFAQKGTVLVIVFCILAVALSTFMSNTATANLLIPIVMIIPGESNTILATTIALSCSLAMALPVSTPPNAIAFATNMLKSKDMFKAGLAISILSVAIILLGFKFVLPLALKL